MYVHTLLKLLLLLLHWADGSDDNAYPHRELDFSSKLQKAK